MTTENTNRESCLDIIERIEKLLPLEYDVLIRTNHDFDGVSSAPWSEGGWFVHLTKCRGHRNHGNAEQRSIYCEYGNDLYKILCEAEDKIKKEINNKQNTKFWVKRTNDDIIVSIMYDRSDQKYHFVNLTKNHICACGFDTIDDAIDDMEKAKSNGEIIDYW